MCGRYALRVPFRVIHDALEGFVTALQKEAARQLGPRYNIAPTQSVPVLSAGPDGRHFGEMKWGLIPPWAKDESVAYKMINARAETIQEKPSYKKAFQSRRCLLLADGFYEWEHEGRGKAAIKTPHLFSLKYGNLFGFAGLWDTWRSPAGPLQSCTLITTTPNELVEHVHNRMPVMLERGQWEKWLDPDTTPDDLMGMLAPYPADKMVESVASRRLNKAGIEGADLLVPDEK